MASNEQFIRSGDGDGCLVRVVTSVEGLKRYRPVGAAAVIKEVDDGSFTLRVCHGLKWRTVATGLPDWQAGLELLEVEHGYLLG
jgi:hypothetical protein